MSDGSAIEWTDATWNPVTGCTKVSAGCDNCYAERIAERFRGLAGHAFENGFDLTLQPKRLGQPAKWRKPRMVFVNSMSDMFHKDIPADYLASVFDAMEHADRHTYQVLTKRSPRMRAFVRQRYGSTGAPPHIWLGVSIEDRQALARLRHLQETPAAVRFISFEPLLGPITSPDLAGIQWAIVGGESGPGARPVEASWIRALRDACLEQGVPFFFKQWGGRTPKSGGALLDGKAWRQFPRLENRHYQPALAGLIPTEEH